MLGFKVKQFIYNEIKITKKQISCPPQGVKKLSGNLGIELMFIIFKQVKEDISYEDSDSDQ